MPVDPVREAAIDVLLRVFDKGAYLDQALDRTIRRKEGLLSARGRRFLTRLVYGVTRHRLLADHVLAPRVSRALDELPLPILLILRMGVFQAIFCDNVTFPAMVHTSVDLAKRKGHAGTARLVNAVLKRVPQSLDEVELPDREAGVPSYLSVRYSLPPWLVEGWLKEFGEAEAEELCAASDSEAPRTARTNTLHTDRDSLLATLAKTGHSAAPHPDAPEAITFVDSGIPWKSKAYQRGLFYPQDPASMLPPHLVDPRPGQVILDLCAAPGGKATHLSALAGGEAYVVANDRDLRRGARIAENRERLKTPRLALLASDGLAPPFLAAFDAVLLDAPCTGLGTLRRHPDLKWRVQPGDAERLAEGQARLLRSAIALCKNKGSVVYSVCTFTAEETERVIQSVLGDGQVTLEDGPAWLNRWKISPGQYRILPRKGGLDGYFMARLRKGS